MLLAGCASSTERAPASETQVVDAEPRPKVADYLNLADLIDDDESIGMTAGDPFEVSVPNSAGGVDFGFRISNVSSDTFDYVTVEVTPYNAVGDQVASSVGNESTQRLTATGPFAPGESKRVVAENAWYNGNIVSANVTAIEVELSSGEVLDLDLGSRILEGEQRCMMPSFESSFMESDYCRPY